MRFVPVLFICVAAACSRRDATRHDSAAARNGEVVTESARLAASGLTFPYLPDTARTPGATLEVTRSDICVRGYSKKVRNVPSSVKRNVYRSYGIARHAPGEYEVDHLISLELGGSNSQRNLWPESFRTSPWNAHVKDQLENELHRRVCNGTVDLAVAQHEIAVDWVAAWRKYFKRDLPQ